MAANRDDIGTTGAFPRGVPVPPHIQEIIDNARAALSTGVGEQHSTIDAKITDIGNQVSTARTDVIQAIHEQMGSVDNSLSLSRLATDKALDKSVSEAQRSIGQSQYLLGTAGVHVPASVDQIRADLGDDTGLSMIDRLAGIAPSVPGPYTGPGSSPDNPLITDLPAHLCDPPNTPPVGADWTIDPGCPQPVWVADPHTGVTGAILPPCIPGEADKTPAQQLADCMATQDCAIELRLPCDGTTSPPTVPPTVPPTIPPTIPPTVPPVIPPVVPPVVPSTCPPAGECCPVNVTIVVPPPAPCVAPAPPAPPTAPPTVPPVSPGVPPVPPVPPTSPPSSPPSSPPGPPDMPPPTSPPGPPLIPPPPGMFGEINYPDTGWDNPSVCSDVSAALSKIEYHYTLIDPIAAGTTALFDKTGVWSSIAGITARIPFVGDAINTALENDIDIAVHSILSNRIAADMVANPIALDILSGVPSDVIPNQAVARDLGSLLGAIQFTEAQTGFPLSYLCTTYRYEFNWANPQYLPSQADIDRMFLSGLIDQTGWECWTRAQGNLPRSHFLNVYGQRTRMNIGELLTSWRRGDITDDGLAIEMRRIGVLEEGLVDRWKTVTASIPGPSDLVRMMVRDSADDKVAEQYGYDSNFSDKFVGRVKDWAKMNGMDADVFKYLWRAHWQIPSPTQLYEMLHRLRVDSPVYQAYIQQLRLLPKLPGVIPPEPPFQPVSKDDIKYALNVNDMAPAWVDRLVAISYHPITRTDALQAYEMGVFTEDDLRSAMLDNGYSPVDADRLVLIQRAIKSRRTGSLAGTWSIRSICRSYMDGELDAIDADRLLTPLVVDPLQRQMMISSADTRVKANNTKQLLKRARRAFFVGETDEVGTRNVLRLIGTPVNRIDDLIVQWNADRTGRYREPSVAMIVKWCALNVIGLDDAYARIIRLGFSELDAKRIVFQGVDAWQTKVRAEINAEMRTLSQTIKNQAQAKASDAQTLKTRSDMLLNQIKAAQNELDRITKELSGRKPSGGA